jgi:hypothetical protein
MALTFPITPDGLVVDVFVNHEVSVLLPLWQAGVRPPPIAARGLIDTGNDITGVSLVILQQLGVQPIVQTTTHGVGGTVPVNVYRVSLQILDARDTTLPWIANPTLDVMELPPSIPFDVLIGLDILLTCKLFVDGPAGQFTLDR